MLVVIIDENSIDMLHGLRGVVDYYSRGDIKCHHAYFPLLLPDRSSLLTNTTNTAAYLIIISQLVLGFVFSQSWIITVSTHAALPAKISARLAFVMSPTLSAKATVKAHIMPRIAVLEFTKDILVIGPTNKIIATMMFMRATAIGIDRSLKRVMRLRPSLETTFCANATVS